MKEIIINKDEDDVIVALLENGKLVEEYDNINNAKTLEGNIYCGIVRNVLPNMQSAFIDIGESKNAFIHIKDIIPKTSEITGNKEEDYSKYKMKDFVKQKEPILVQIKKDKESLKGARVSKDISLVGRFCVLLINVNFITVSQKIESKEEKERLKNVANEILKKYEKDEKYGLILRTAASEKSKEEIERDIVELIEYWKQIKSAYEEVSKEGKPVLIFENYNIVSKFLLGVLDSDINQITVNNKTLFEQIKEQISELKKPNIELCLQENDLMQKHNLEHQISKIHERKIWLKCGGFITIDKTEALTAIDVNSGKYTGKSKENKELALLRVNKEATVEIAKQIRLRNISGIIVIDYIDMQKDEERQQILNLLNKELKKDRSKTQVVGFTQLDLLEMTRKKL